MRSVSLGSASVSLDAGLAVLALRQRLEPNGQGPASYGARGGARQARCPFGRRPEGLRSGVASAKTNRPS